MSFAKDVWTDLSELNVNEHVEEKGKFSYLAWNWAWATLMDRYPESTIDDVHEKTLDNNTVECWVTVTVRRGEKTLTRTMWLPVMDARNAAIIDPNSRDISDTRMRCMTKCLGLFGLGFYIYQKESLPASESVPIDEQQAVVIRDMLEATGSNVDGFLKWLDAKSVDDIPAGKYDMALKMLKRKEAKAA